MLPKKLITKVIIPLAPNKKPIINDFIITGLIVELTTKQINKVLENKIN